MPARLPYEMSFLEFADNYKPGWMISVSHLSEDHPTWLFTAENHRNNLIVYRIYWHDTDVLSHLPATAGKLVYPEKDIDQMTQSLALDVNCQEDKIKTAMLKGACDTWVELIRTYCRSTANSQEDAGCGLKEEAKNDYLRLTSAWQEHPWVRQLVKEYVDNVPGASVSSRPWRHDGSSTMGYEEPDHTNDIVYWTEYLESENNKWPSPHSEDIWCAQVSVKLAQRKIAELEKLIECQEKLIRETGREIRRLKRLEALELGKSPPGRLKIPDERHELSVRFIAAWVAALMQTLGVANCTALARVIKDSNPRNWRRWLAKQAVPTLEHFKELMKARIVDGEYKGATLDKLPTEPRADALMALLREAWIVRRSDLTNQRIDPT